MEDYSADRSSLVSSYLLSTSSISYITTSSTASVMYGWILDPSAFLLEMERAAPISPSYAHEIIKNMPESTRNSLLVLLNDGVIDQSIIKIRNMTNEESVAIRVKDFLNALNPEYAIDETVGWDITDRNGDYGVPPRLLEAAKWITGTSSIYDSIRTSSGSTSSRSDVNLRNSFRNLLPLSSSPAEYQLMQKNRLKKIQKFMKVFVAFLYRNKFIMLVALLLALLLSASLTVIWTSLAITTTTQTGTMSNARPTDCYDRLLMGEIESGIYHLYPPGIEPFEVYCDMITDGGGWTVLQKRIDNSIIFWDRPWSDYKNGFGNLEANYWLGLDRMHVLTTKDSNVSLRLETIGQRCISLAGTNCDSNIPFSNDTFLYGEFHSISIEDEANKYRLHCSTLAVGNITNANDWWHNHLCNQFFSTVDHHEPDNNCTFSREWGAWWHPNTFTNSKGESVCSTLDFNGKYYPARGFSGDGFSLWRMFQEHGRVYPYQSEIKIRRSVESVDLLNQALD